MEATLHDNWARSRKFIVFFAIFIFFVISVQATAPLYIFMTLIWFRAGHEILQFLLTRALKQFATYIFVLRLMHIFTCLGFTIYFGGPHSPGWLFTILSISIFTVVFPEVCLDFMRNDRITDASNANNLNVNWYSLSFCLLFSAHSSLCCLIMWGNWQTVSVCFVTCVLISLFVNVGVSLIRDLQNMANIVVLNQELEKGKQIAEAANQQKTVFIAKVSHELRTPLHAVICSCDLISDTELSPEQREFVKIISKSSNLLLSLINNILDLSKSEAGKMIIESRSFSLRECAESVVSTMKTKYDQKMKQNVKLYVDENLPELILGDEMRITQVVSDLHFILLTV
jgi:hypothetical protein